MTTLLDTDRSAFRFVTLDLYRDIHKGVRGELFAVASQAGCTDPGDRAARIALADRVTAMTEMLLLHAEHEDKGIQPALQIHLPELAEKVETDHNRIDRRMEQLVAVATATVDAAPAVQGEEIHRLYLELASFVSAYLEHQDVEERVIMPALEAAIGVDAVVAIHRGIIGGIGPEEMAQTLAIMLPAMNIDNRAELLCDIRGGAPAPVFEGIWGLTCSVIAPADRLGLS